MKIGILGAGNVGSSLGKALVNAGHEVMLSSRTPERDDMRALASELGANGQVGSVTDTLAFSPVTALALRWDAVSELIATVKKSAWDGRILIDATNRFGQHERPAAQDLAQMTGARVVKAFNTIGAEHYLDPNFDGQAATMFILGDDADAKAIVTGLAGDLGFDPFDAGGLDAAAHVEALAAFWVYLMRSGQGRNFAFKLVRK